MEPIPVSLALDVSRAGVQAWAHVRQHETNRALRITLRNGTAAIALPANAQAVLRAVKSDATLIFDDCAIAADTITQTLTPQILAVTGTVNCELAVYDGAGRSLYSPHFQLLVESAPLFGAEAITSTDEYAALVASLNRCSSLIDDTLAAANAAQESELAAAQSALCAAADAARVANATQVEAHNANAQAHAALFAAKANAAHAHGGLSAAGALGDAANKAAYTGANGLLTAGTLPLAAGGTGAVSAEAARKNLVCIAADEIGTPTTAVPGITLRNASYTLCAGKHIVVVSCELVFANTYAGSNALLRAPFTPSTTNGTFYISTLAGAKASNPVTAFTTGTIGTSGTAYPASWAGITLQLQGYYSL